MGSNQSTQSNRSQIVPGEAEPIKPSGPDSSAPTTLPASSSSGTVPAPAPAPVAVSSSVKRLQDDSAGNMMRSWARDITKYVRLGTLALLGGNVPEFQEELRGYDVAKVVDALKRTVDDDFYAKSSYLVGFGHAYTDLDPQEAARLSDIFVRDQDASPLTVEELEIYNIAMVLAGLRMAFKDHVDIALDLLTKLSKGQPSDDVALKTFQEDVNEKIEQFYENTRSIGDALDKVLNGNGKYSDLFEAHANATLTQAATTNSGKVIESQIAGQKGFEVFQRIGSALARDLDNKLVDSIQKL